MRNNQDLTPKTVALDIAVGWIAAAYRGHTSDMFDGSITENGRHSDAFERQVKRQLAKLHNRMLRGMNDDLNIYELDEG